MTSEVIQGFVRHLFTTFGGYLAGLGYLSADEVQVFGGAVAVLIGLGWSIYNKKVVADKVG